MDGPTAIAIIFGVGGFLYLTFRFWPPGGPLLLYYPRDLTNPKSWRLWYGKGLPKHPDKHPEGWSFDLGGPGKEVHYVTTPWGTLKGKTKLIVEGRIEGGPVLGRGGGQSVMVLYFQRKWDDWTDSHQLYRWWSSSTLISPIVAGPFRMEFDLTPKGCSSMEGKSAEDFPDAFLKAVRRAGMVGLTFGQMGDGFGHGAMSVAPARIVITHYSII